MASCNNHSLREAACELISSLQEELRDHSTIFAEKEDCDFFRALYRLQKPIEKKIASPLPLKAPPPDSASQKRPEPIAPPLPIAAPPPATLSQKRPEPIAPPRSSIDVLGEVRKTFQRLFPQIEITESILDDRVAKQIAERWKTQSQSAPISILVDADTPIEHAFLCHFTEAIDGIWGNARLIEAKPIELSNGWKSFLSKPDLKWVIISEKMLHRLKGLLALYHEVPNQNETFLLDKPLFLLLPITQYLRDPSLKRDLWKKICQKMQTL